MGGSVPRLVFAALFCLLMLLHPEESSASSSSSLCQSDHFAYTKPYNQQRSLFTINGDPVHIVRFCEAIQIHKAKGCIFEDSFRDDFCTVHYLLGGMHSTTLKILCSFEFVGYLFIILRKKKLVLCREKVFERKICRRRRRLWWIWKWPSSSKLGSKRVSSILLCDLLSLLPQGEESKYSRSTSQRI